MKTTILQVGSAAVLVIAGLLAVEGRASAADQKGGVITLREIEIVGRVQKPIASVDVAKLEPRLTLAELRKPFLNRIEEAVDHDPF